MMKKSNKQAAGKEHLPRAVWAARSTSKNMATPAAGCIKTKMMTGTATTAKAMPAAWMPR